MASCGRCLLYLLYTIMIIIGLFFTLVGALFFTTALNTKGSCTQPSNVINLAHKGDTASFQENTLEAEVSAVSKNLNAEFDINMISSGEIILFHDDNALELTGVDLDIQSANYSQIQQLKYKLTIGNSTYLTQPSIPLLKDTLNAICVENSEADLDFDIKFVPTDENMKALMDIIDASPCLCSNNQTLIFSNPYFYAGRTIRRGFENRRCSGGVVSLWFHPNTLPLGVYFWLKTRWALNLGSADIVSTHYRVWEYYPDLLESFNQDSWCTAVYGNYITELMKYNVTHYRVGDVSDATLEVVNYTGDSDGYNAVLAMTVVGVLILALGLLLLILTCCNCICKIKKDTAPIDSKQI